MDQIADFILKNTERGECHCGQCADKGDRPDPEGHTVDMVFFKVAKRNGATVDDFRKYTTSHSSVFNEVNPFDGKEHSYIELGGWLGDQQLALLYMGLGVSLKQFSLLSPAMLGLTGDAARQMAGMGLLSIQAEKENSNVESQ